MQYEMEASAASRTQPPEGGWCICHGMNRQIGPTVQLAGLMSIRGPGGMSDRVRNPVGRRRVRRRAAAGCAGAGCDNMSAMVVLLKAFAPDLAAAQAKAATPLPAP